MEKHFNVSRYQELLKLEEKEKISLLDENGVLDETYFEFLSYRASVHGQMRYNRKQDYFSFIHQYLSRVISPSEFRSKFLEMKKEDSKKATPLLEDFQALEVLTLAEDLETFSDLTGKISTLCLEYNIIWGDTERMSENEFYSLVNNLYLQLQKAFPVEIWEISSNKHLVSRSFKFLIFTIGFEILFILWNLRIAFE